MFHYGVFWRTVEKVIYRTMVLFCSHRRMLPAEVSETAAKYRQNKKGKQRKNQTIWQFMENNVKKQNFFKKCVDK